MNWLTGVPFLIGHLECYLLRMLLEFPDVSKLQTLLTSFMFQINKRRNWEDYFACWATLPIAYYEDFFWETVLYLTTALFYTLSGMWQILTICTVAARKGWNWPLMTTDHRVQKLQIIVTYLTQDKGKSQSEIFLTMKPGGFRIIRNDSLYNLTG